MKPAEYFEILYGNTQDCHEDPGSVRRAFNAAVSASHLADHIYQYSSRHGGKLGLRYPNFANYIDHLGADTSGAFTEVRSIANAYKHLYTTGGAVDSSVSSAGAIVSVELTDPGQAVTRVAEAYEIGASNEAKTFVTFTRRNGSTSAFLPVLDAVVEYFCDEIFATPDAFSPQDGCLPLGGFYGDVKLSSSSSYRPRTNPPVLLNGEAQQHTSPSRRESSGRRSAYAVSAFRTRLSALPTLPR